MTISYDISQVAPYINWAYFYFAWQLKDVNEQQNIRQEADTFLRQLEGQYKTHAVFRLLDAYSEDDDIVVLDDSDAEHEVHIACLRQQQLGSDYLCLPDFLPPKAQAAGTRIGLFATSVDHGLETDFERDAYAKMMAQLLADRLAEATAELMHLEVRRRYWGYAADEQLSIDDLHAERFQGIRPAVGYPSLPDASLNFVLDRLLNMGQIGIRLTENGAMRPHASVSGLMIAHPKARYFAVGKVGDDQLHDYARRRAMPVELARKFLAANL